MAATHEGTCPVCQHTQKVVRGGMAKHGYRVAWHEEIGQCWGSYKAPWEQPEGRDALKRYVDSGLQTGLALTQTYLAELRAGKVTSLHHHDSFTNKDVEVTTASPRWASRLEHEVSKTEWECKAMGQEIALCHARIEKWAPGSLRAVTPATPTLPFSVKEGEVVLARHQGYRAWNGRYTYGWEVWDGKGWVRVAGDTVKALVKAGKARWLNEGETPPTGA
jgi:hypothetical protein